MLDGRQGECRQDWQFPSQYKIINAKSISSYLTREHPEMSSFTHSPRERILWILANNGDKMERSRLRVATGMRYAMLNPILEELMKEGRVRIAVGKQGDIISIFPIKYWYTIYTMKTFPSHMPRPEYLGRCHMLYISSKKDLEMWEDRAKRSGISLSKYILEMAERGYEIETSQPRGSQIAQELGQMREDTRRMREELKLKSLVLEKYETELFRLRNESFVCPDFEGVRQYSKDLVNLLRRGGAWAGPEILKDLHIDPRDSDAVQILYRQLQILQSLGLVSEEARGWRWTS